MKNRDNKQTYLKGKKIVKSGGYLVAGVAAASIVAGCSSDKEKWRDSPGTNGHINLAAVKKCFQKYPSLPEFEKRLNEIYEGDNLIILESEKIRGGFSCKAYEDLDKSKDISPKDDALFILKVANGRATLQGLGVNNYYKESWPYYPGEHMQAQRYGRHTYGRHYYGFYYWYTRPFGGYYTPEPRYNNMQSHRDSYRQSSAFKNQVQDNLNFEKRASSRYGSKFRKSSTKISSARQSYIHRASSAGSYKSSGKTSGWGVRSSSFGSKTSSFSSARSSGRGGFGGFRGGSGFGI